MKNLTLFLIFLAPFTLYGQSEKNAQTKAMDSMERQMQDLNRKAEEAAYYLSESAKKFSALSAVRTNTNSTQSYPAPSVLVESRTTVRRVNTSVKRLEEFQKQREEAETALEQVREALFQAQKSLDDLEEQIRVLKAPPAEIQKQDKEYTEGPLEETGLGESL